MYIYISVMCSMSVLEIEYLLLIFRFFYGGVD